MYSDKGPINARAAYNYRSKWDVGNDTSGSPNFRDSEGFLDSRASYSFFDDRLTFFAEAKNLTDQASRSYAGAHVRLNELGFPGRRYFLGFSIRN